MVILATRDNTKTPEVNQFIIRIDVPDKDIAKAVTVPIGGTTVNYGHTYYTTPIVTPTASGIGNSCYFNDKTTSSVFLQVFNSSNVDVGGSVDLRVKGY